MRELSHAEVRISPYRPAQAFAQTLRGEGVYARELLELAEQWPTARHAWDACERVELLLPIAFVLGRPLASVAGVAATWWRSAVAELAGPAGARRPTRTLGWPIDDAAIAARCVHGACAPDCDVIELREASHEAIARAGRRAPGRHRYRLLTAAAHVAQLGIRRVRSPYGAAADGELVGEHLRGALEDASGAAAADLFAHRPDVEGWTAGALEHARRELGGQP